MAEPLVQRIVSKYNDEGVKKYIRDLERIQKLEKDADRARQRSKTTTKRLGASAQRLGGQFKRWIGGVAVVAVLALATGLFKLGKAAVRFQASMAGARCRVRGER